MQDIFSSLTNTAKHISQGDMSIEDVVTHARNRISEKDTEVHALLGLYSEESINEQIQKAKQMMSDGTQTELTGVPIVLKDNILVEGEKATGGSKILENYTSPYDATVVTKLKDAGAILLGRANMDEFAMGGSTENSAFGPTRNPHDLTKVAGGSSGGSAAVVAYGGVPISLGSDTGGSIRQPASFCGIVGLKPTYGNTSRYGLMAMGSSLDQIGPFGHTVSCVESVYRIITGHDSHDATSYARSDAQEIRPIKKIIGVPRSFVESEGVDKEVLANFTSSLEKMKSLGYSIVDISLDQLDTSLSVYYILMFAEVSSNLARYDGIRYGLSVKAESSIASYFATKTEGFGDEVRRRILLGTYVLSSGYYDAYYNKAMAMRAHLKKEFASIFSQVDVIATPTSPIPAFSLGEKSNDPLSMYLADIFTVPVNIVGVPAISIPSGVTTKGLPLGIQFIASHKEEETLFTIGKDFEKVY